MGASDRLHSVGGGVHVDPGNHGGALDIRPESWRKSHAYLIEVMTMPLGCHLSNTFDNFLGLV